MPRLSRNPIGNEVSNTATATPSVDSQPWQFYEQTYGTTGAQESIYGPDGMAPVSVTLSGSGSWVATVEATDSPPDVVAAGNGVWVAWPIGTVSAVNSASIVTGATAIRANVTTVGTYVKLSVRC